MSALKRFKEIEAQKAKDEAESNVRAKAASSRYENQEKELWDAFVKSYKEFDKQTLQGKKLEFKPAKGKRHVSLYVNGELYLIFFPKWRHYSCHCENVCSCEVADPDVTIEAVQKKKDGTDYYLYFPCYNLDDFKGGKFGDAMFEALGKWEYRNF
jgi:hypothetical protein